MKYIKFLTLILATTLIFLSLPLCSHTVQLGIEELIIGDINGDGRVNPLDANYMKRYIAGGDVSIIIMNADFNFDGRVDSLDSNMLKRLLAGI